ncbi:MAG: LLM class flavin-dependent oxidoreductase [Burkholderiales bacterium]|nr:LLM class flavin-dependent oxidoreductase [Anaerolineae bacterium]
MTKLGLFMMPVHPPEKSRTVCFDEDVELIVRADELGFSEAWVGQHHTLAWEPIPANDIFLANLIARTKQIKLGTGVSIVPQHHPANIAVRLALLDHLSHGRIMCGFGQGGVPTDWELFDLPDPKTQGLMTIEGIDMVMKLWAAEPPFDFQGQFWHIKILSPNPELGIGTLLKPYQQPHPPIAMSMVKAGSMAARMAGQRGYIPISSSLVPTDVVIDHWKNYTAGALEAGRGMPDRNEWRLSRSILIGRTNDEAWEHALTGSFGRTFKYLKQLLQDSNLLQLFKHDPNMPDDEVTVESAIRNVCIIGGPNEVAQQLHDLWDATGGFGSLLMTTHDWDDKERWIYSLETLANEIVPSLPTLEKV